MSETLPALQPRIIRTALAGLFAHLPLVTGVAAICMAVVILFTFVSHPKYRSEARFLVRNARGSNVISSERSPMNTVADVSEEQINSELEILQSEDVLSAVADPSWNAMTASSASSAVLKQHEDKLTKLRSNLSVSPIRKSNVIEAVYLARTPQDARDVLSRLSAAYLSAHERLARPQGSTAFFENQAGRYRAQWSDAVNDLVKFQREHGIVSISDKEDKLNQRLNDVQDAMLQNNASLAQLTSEISGNTTAINALNQRNETQVRTLPNQIASEQMRSQLLRLQNQKTELLTRYKPSDRLVAETDREIATTTEALRDADVSSSIEKTTDINPNWQQMQAALLRARVSREGAVGKNLQLNSQASQIQSQLKDIEALQLEYSSLQEAVLQAKTNYETFAQKWDQEQIEDAMDGHRLSNVALAEAPTSSYRPFSPRPLMNIALGFVTSAFLVGGLLYVLETFRTTIAIPRELDALSRFPVLATIPKFSEPSVLRDEPSTSSLLQEVLPDPTLTTQALAYAGHVQRFQQGPASSSEINL
jgi:uncharacterized protein involved in exopolysaccharide biosynthesis